MFHNANSGHAKKSSLSRILPHRRNNSSAEGHSPPVGSDHNRSSDHTAPQFDKDQEKERIKQCCFSRTDEQGQLLESYISHVRILEDSHYQSSRPPPSSPVSAKKQRIIIIASRLSGRVRVHKARENPDGTFQIGKTWNLEELSKLENDPNSPTGFSIDLGKTYYWVTNSRRDKDIFINSILKVYKRYTQGKLPHLIGLEATVDPVILRNDSSSSLLSTESRNHSSTGSHGRSSDSNSPTMRMSNSLSSSNRFPASSRAILAPEIPPKLHTDQFAPAFDRRGSNSTFESTPSSPYMPTRSEQSLPQKAVRKGNSQSSISIVPPVLSPRKSESKFKLPSSPSQPVLAGKSNSSQSIRQIPTKPGSMHSTDWSQPTNQFVSANESMSTIPDDYSGSGIDSPIRTRGDSYEGAPHNRADVDTDDNDLRKAHGFPIVGERLESLLDAPEQATLAPLRTEKRASVLSDVKIYARATPPDDEDGNGDSYEMEKEKLNVLHQSLPLVRGHQKNKSSLSSVGSRSSYVKRKLSLAGTDVHAIEDTLVEFDWSGKDGAASLEKRIKDEIAQIEVSYLHDIVDLDEKLDELDNTLENAIAECDNLESVFAFFSVQLGGPLEDVTHIESQGQGLQIQTTNQKIIWTELRNLLSTVSLSEKQMKILQQGSFDSSRSLQDVETALLGLSEALKTVRSRDGNKGSNALGQMRALKERRALVEKTAADFVLRFRFFCEEIFRSALTEAEKSVTRNSSADEEQAINIDRQFLERTYPLSGIILFTKEADSDIYYSIIKNYSLLIGPHYNSELSAFYARSRAKINSYVKQADKFSFVGSKRYTASVERSVRRSNTLAKLDFRDKPHLTNEEEEFSWALSSSSLAGATKTLERVIQVTTVNVMSQQELLIQLFHMSSYGWKGFSNFLKEHPIENRAQTVLNVKVREIEADRGKSQSVSDTLQVIFDNIQEHLQKVADELTKSMVLLLPAMIFLLERELSRFHGTNQEFLQQIYQKVYSRLNAIWASFTNEQCQDISGTHVSSKKRKGVLFFVSTFSKFCFFIEQEIDSLNISDGDNVVGQTRRLIDDSYEKIYKTVMHNLQRVAKEGPTDAAANGGIVDYENKEMLNYHIMMIENMAVLKDDLGQSHNLRLRKIAENAQQIYRDELNHYIELVLHRPFGKLMDFVNGVEGIIAKSPTENPTKRHGYGKSALKKILALYDAREIKKCVEALRRRVDKHFNEEESATGTHSTDESTIVLIDKVWSALQADTSMLYSRLKKIIDEYYAGPGEPIQMEFNKQDIFMAFGRK